MSARVPHAAVNVAADAPVTPRGLRLDLRRECVCVLPEALAFSWQLGPDRTGACQEAYRITVSVGEAGIPVYDSGFVSSAEMTGVTPEGIAGALTDGERLYRWAVQVRLTDGRVSEFQNGQFFTVAQGPLSVSNGMWAPGGPYFALFRRGFSVPEGTTRVLVCATAISPEPARQFVYNLYVNGAEIGVGPSRLDKLTAPDDANNVLYYSTYDITDMIDLAPGAQNRLTALCHAAEGQAFYAEILCFDRFGFKHGDRPVVQKNGGGNGGREGAFAGWQARNGDIVFRPDNSIGTHYYRAYAANIDAAAAGETGSWDGEGWTDAETAEGAFDGYVLLPARTGAVKRYARPLPPEAVRRTENGYFIDLGQEIVGGLSAAVDAAEETELEVRFGEELNADGSVRFAMRTGNIYTARWHVLPGPQTLATPDMMTFRYAEFRASTPFSLRNVRGLELRAAADDGESAFSCDNALLKQFYDLTKYTIKMTTQDLYVDSQSRERGAYEGDALINMLASYTFYSETAVPRATLEYLYTHRTWPAEYILLMPGAALADALRTGDLRSARKYYPLLRKDNFLKNTGANGLVHSGNRAAQGTDAVLYDWPPSERDNYDTSVLYPTVLNALQVRCLLDLAGLARLVGEDVDAVRFEAQAETLAHALTEQTFDPEQGAFCDGIREDGTRSAHCSQHASAYVLYCLGGSGGELLSEAQAAAAVDFIRAQKGLRTSVYGAFFVLLGLYRSFVPGAAELASELLLNEDPEDRRTWAYMLRGLGATLTAEAWCPENKPNMTFSHPWSAAPAVLISQGIFGLEPLAPGWKRFRVNFRRAGIGRASIVLPTPAGSVRASFDGDNYEVVIPPGAAAEIRVGDRPVLTAEAEGPREFRFIVEKSGKFSE